jgi:hypothetical protein
MGRFQAPRIVVLRAVVLRAVVPKVAVRWVAWQALYSTAQTASGILQFMIMKCRVAIS